MLCPNCKKEIQKEQSFCLLCGYVIAKDESENVSDEISPNEAKQIAANKSEAKPSYLVKALAAVLVVFLCVVVGLFVKDFLYKQSDQYKIEKATEAILKGDYYNSVREIEDIDTATANAMREYIIVLRKRDELIKSHSSTNLATDSVAFDNYLSALKNFDEYYFLPERLLNLYKDDLRFAESILKDVENWYPYLVESEKILLYTTGIIKLSPYSNDGLEAAVNFSLFDLHYVGPTRNEYTELLCECFDELISDLEEGEEKLDNNDIQYSGEHSFDSALPTIYNEEDTVEIAQLLKYTYMRDVMISKTVDNFEWYNY